MDELIAEYARRLELIYENRTAGDYTFEGVLSEFARAVADNRPASMIAIPCDQCGKNLCHGLCQHVDSQVMRVWSSHGHWIASGDPQPADYATRPALTARCGGPGMCDQCSREAGVL